MKIQRNAKTAKRTWREWLIYREARQSRATIRRYYLRYREERGLSTQCDMDGCHMQPVWNGKPLPLILDHKNGNCCDNRPDNLRFLCPNCNAQLPTNSGANRGRVVDPKEAGFTIKAKEKGRCEVYIIPKTGQLGC